MILPQRRSSSSPRTTSSTRTEGARALRDIPLVRLARDIARLEPRTAWRTAGTRTGRRPSPMRRSASRSPPRSSKVGAARARSNNVPGGARHSRTTPPTTGYYRLATAQVELHQYDVAANTIKQGFEHDSGGASALVSRSAQRPVISRWHKPLFCRSESGAQQAHAYRQGASSAGARDGRPPPHRAREQAKKASAAAAARRSASGLPARPMDEGTRKEVSPSPLSVAVRARASARALSSSRKGVGAERPVAASQSRAERDGVQAAGLQARAEARGAHKHGGGGDRRQHADVPLHRCAGWRGSSARGSCEVSLTRARLRCVRQNVLALVQAGHQEASELGERVACQDGDGPHGTFSA